VGLARFARYHGQYFRSLETVTSPASTTAEVEEIILRYITAHPDACDSLEGIVSWWLTRQRHDDARREVMAAVQHLVASGRMEASTGLDGSTLYCAARPHRGGGEPGRTD
jgi:hypothetical protein